MNKERLEITVNDNGVVNFNDNLKHSNMEETLISYFDKRHLNYILAMLGMTSYKLEGRNINDGLNMVLGSSLDDSDLLEIVNMYNLNEYLNDIDPTSILGLPVLSPFISTLSNYCFKKYGTDLVFNIKMHNIDGLVFDDSLNMIYFASGTLDPFIALVKLVDISRGGK